MATIKHVTDIYIRSTGVYEPLTTGTNYFYPNANYSNKVNVYLEDGTIQDTFVQINFLINGKYATEWLPLFKGGDSTVEIEGVNVAFTKYSILVPRQVLQNASPTTTKTIGVSVRSVYGSAWKGSFDTLADLEAEWDLTEEFDGTYTSLGEQFADEYYATYVCQDTEGGETGFYQVQYDDVEQAYKWVQTSLVNTYQEVKSYSVGDVTLQKGFVNPKGTITLTESTTTSVFQALANIEDDVDQLEIDVADLDDTKLENDFGEYDPKTTYNDGDSIAINDDEDTGNPKEMALSDLMKSENVSFDNSGSVGIEADDVKEAIEELETDIIAVDDKVDLHIADETNPHNVTATQTSFSPTDTIDSDTVQEAVEEVRELLDDFPLDNIFAFDMTAGDLEYVLYVIARDAPEHCVFHGVRDGNFIFGTSTNLGGGQLKVTLITPTDVQVLEYDATSGALGTITSEQSISGIFDGTEIVKKAEQDASGNVITTTYATKTERSDGDALKVDKDLSGYSTATLAGSQVMYVQDGSNYKKATLSALRTFIAGDFVSFGYVIASADVDGLPDVAEPLTNKIYLVATGDEEEDNIYNEFIYVEGEWELFGTTQLDLELDSDIEATATVGGVTSGDILSKGMTYQEVINLILKPVISQYKVVFKDFYGEVAKTQIVNENESAEAPTLSSPAGQTFEGWDKEFTNVTSNLIINPVYSIKKISVYFRDYDNSIIELQRVDYGGAAVLPEDPSRTGYTFEGWSGNTEYVTNTRSIIATYSRIVLEVTFEDYDGTILGVFDVNYGDDATAPDVPFRTGYNFTGWDVPLENITEDTTITAEYAIREYTVRYLNYNGSSTWGGTNHTQTVEHGSDATVPVTDPTRAGYTFVEWDRSNENITANKDITAIFIINQYTVTFEDWDGTVLKTEDVNHGSSATPPADPTKSGSVFSGWEGNYNNVTGTRTITAIYDVAVYTVIFVDWDGSTHAEERVLHGESASLPEDPERDGYTFVEWDGNYESVSDDEELTAVYTVNEYTITFDVDGGSAIDAITQDYNTEITPPGNPTKDYNTFDGWDSELPTRMPSEDITVIAQWVAETYTVTFKDWDGTILDEQTIEHGSDAILPETPTRDGHNFLSWTGADHINVTSDRTITASYGIETYTVTFQHEDETIIEVVDVLYLQDATPPTPPEVAGLTFSEWLGDYEGVTEDTTVTAIYGEDLYTVTFVDDDEITVLSTDVVAYGEDATAPSDPTKTGYTFDEWDGDFTNVTDNVTVIATYTRNYYTVTYLDDDGTLLKTDENIEHGTASTPPADPTQEGKTFSGWDTPVTVITNDTEIRATYDLIIYTVTFEDYDGSFIAEYNVENGDASPSPSDPTRTGYTFNGWDEDFSNVTADLTVTAQYTINQYTLTYNVNGGTPISSQEYDYDEVLSLGSTTKETYDFVGWYTDSSLTTEFTLTNMPAANTTIYAKWTIKTFIVTFKDYDDSTIGTPQTVAYGQNATAPSVSRTGYAFTGWSNPYSNVTDDVTTTAQYSINQYNIIFNRNGGSSVSTQAYDYGETIVPPTDPTRTGYTFDGWSPSLPATMPSNNLTVTAQWAVNEYTITFNSNGGSSVSAITQDYGTSISEPSDPTKSGYNFGGWFTNTALTISYNFTTMPAQNITLHAKWTSIPYIYYGSLGETLDAGSSDKEVKIKSLTASVNPQSGDEFEITGYSGDKAIVVAYPKTLGSIDSIDRPIVIGDDTGLFTRYEWTVDSTTFYVYVWNDSIGFAYDPFDPEYVDPNPPKFEVIL